MQEYCAYIVGPDGHILNRIDLFCANEEESNVHVPPFDHEFLR
jgi:hypothetical protein